MGHDTGVHTFDEAVGLLKRASIIKYLPDRGTILVKLATGQQASKGQNPTVPVEVPAPHSLFYNNGLYIGTMPAEGTPVVIGQSNTGYHFVSFLAETKDVPALPALNLGELLIKSNNSTKITLNDKSNIYLGSNVNNIHINTKYNLITTNFSSQNNFSQAGRKIEGVVKRDSSKNTDINKLENDDYDSRLTLIGFDPTVTANSLTVGPSKNPPFVESRELLYEFQYSSDIEDDLRESTKYGQEKPTALDFSFPNRRKSRTDTLSLSLVAPNYLMETVKGTVVDVFHNILDLNRYPLPIGKSFNQNTINKEQSKDKGESFILIKELERKSIAFHFEINARKDLTSPTGLSLPDINSNDDWARNRSRFFVDVDKEGQFKINVPASSEKGNIPLLTRYENYSTFGPEDNGNPNKEIYQGAGNNFDIYHDSFAAPALTAVSEGFSPATDKGSIILQTGDNAQGAPQDRITGSTIKHGTAYHDILQTCFMHQTSDFLNYQAGEVDPKTVDIEAIPLLQNVVSSTIPVSGDSAKAGGRSGQINLDGSLELNIGANTIDRQSLWLDAAGGMVTNIGRDINGRSVVAALGGDFFLQIGGFGVMGDSRFVDQNNGIKGAVLDLRIMTDGGYCHMVRCDNNGVTIMTPGNMAIHAKGDMTLTSDKDIRIECNTLTMQERMHLKSFGGSS